MCIHKNAIFTITDDTISETKQITRAQEHIHKYIHVNIIMTR